jgi:hypothetical protein
VAQLQAVGFRLVKDGGKPDEWEDFFAYDTGRPADGSARCVVLDGASTAFDAQRWADQLGRAFVDREASPRLQRGDLLDWINEMQDRWQDGVGAAALNEFEEISARDGSFATFLGCQFDGLDTPEPTWRAAALGDVVLFHVRRNSIVGEPFPNLGPDGFGIDPPGISTLPRMRGRMEQQLLLSSRRPLQVGDTLYLASDALAEWLVHASTARWWGVLSTLDDQAVFEHLVRGQRAAGLLKNDDVTLLRVDVTAGDPDFFVVGR